MDGERYDYPNTVSRMVSRLADKPVVWLLISLIISVIVMGGFLLLQTDSTLRERSFGSSH
jgi:hypothetical protein